MKFEKYFDDFYFIRLEFIYRAFEDVQLHEFNGSAIRGALGRAMKQTCGCDINADCKNCLKTEKCFYLNTFESPRPDWTTEIRGSDNIPHPFILVLPENQKSFIKKTEKFSISMNVIGTSCHYLEYYIETMKNLGLNGIGPNRGRLILEKCYSLSAGGKKVKIHENGVNTFDSLQFINFKKLDLKERKNLTSLKIKFNTPVRIQHNGNILFNIDFPLFVRNILRRLTYLNYFYIKNEKANIDFNSLLELSQKVKSTGQCFQKKYIARASSRQGRTHELHGITGETTFEGNEISNFYGIIKLCEYMNIGKSTGFGMGKYQIEFFKNGGENGKFRIQ